MATNPYTPGQVPRVLAGRADEQRRIEDRLARVATFGELAGPLLVFHAPRGLGKTSLLRAAQDQSAAMGFVPVWVACSRDTPLLPELVRRFEQALADTDSLPRGAAGGRWRKLLERVTLEVGVPGAKVQAQLATSAPEAPDAGPGAAPIIAVEQVLHEACTLVRKNGGAGILLLVDEVHATTSGELGVLLNVLQNLDGRRSENPLTAVAAGLPVSPEAITRAATFGERSTFVALDTLNPADARALLVAPAEAEGVTWDEPALTLLTDEAHGHPYLLQLFGSTTWDAAGPQRGGRLTEADARRGMPAAQAQLVSMHRARWGTATNLERRFLRAMAEAGGASATGNVTRAAIAAGMGVDSRSISAPRERLIDKGVIEPVGHGLVRFTLPGFGEFVRGLDEA